MRFFINIFLITLLFASTEESYAQHHYDTTLEGHTVIVKAKYHYKLPVIADTNFCKELGEIKVPENIAFIDSSDGRETSYFFSFTLVFHRKNNAPDIKERNNSQDKAIRPIIADIMLLLKIERWKVYPGSQGHEIYFACSLTKEGIKEVILSSNDDRDLYDVCK
jgi:hypothetical protein